MGGRDHSETCSDCGVQRGGIMNLKCNCDEWWMGSNVGYPWYLVIVLRNLAHNLAIAAALCRVWQATFNNSLQWANGQAVLWRPGCGHPAP